MAAFQKAAASSLLEHVEYFGENSVAPFDIRLLDSVHFYEFMGDFKAQKFTSILTFSRENKWLLELYRSMRLYKSAIFKSLYVCSHSAIINGRAVFLDSKS